jgi:cytochrome c-type biogenesis protein CcmH
MLWLALTVVTLAVVATIVWPLVRSRRTVPAERGAFDRAVYRDQLAELQRDVERGVIDPVQAGSARLEIERRLLASEAGEARGFDPEKAGAPVDPVTVVMLACFVSAGAIAVYLALGSPKLRDEPLAARKGETAVAQNGDKAPSDLAASLVTLQAKLRDHPDDVEGWLLLARTQGVLERWADAAESYKKAIALTGNGPDAAAGYGEMLVKLADGQVTPAARESFTAALAKDPENPAARFYLALADAQSGKAKAAVDAWTRLIADAPPGAGWIEMVRQNVIETAQKAGLEVPKAALAAPAPNPAPDTTAPGPSAADVAAAGEMSPEDRMKMIRGMVELLAARMKDHPDDVAGWQRLANAYRVLGETDKAAEAASHIPAGAPPAAAAPGPSAADVAAAGAMSPDDRMTMIRGMVERLAARLQQNPNDAEGWQRLANAYRVLGEDKKAEEAAAHLAALQPSGVEALLQKAHALLPPGQGHDPSTALPAGFVAIMKDVEKLDPQQPEALWYLGLAAAQQHDGAAATQYWQRLLGVLPPDSEQYKTVAAAVGAIQSKN